MYAIGCDLGSQSLKGVLLDPMGGLWPRRVPPTRRLPASGLGGTGSAGWQRALAVGDPRPAPRRGHRPAGRRDARARLAGRWARRRRWRGLGPAPGRSSGSIAARPPRPATPGARWTSRHPRADGPQPGCLARGAQDPLASRPAAGLYERAAGLLLPGSALVAWLTGVHVLDHANASSTLLYDVTTARGARSAGRHGPGRRPPWHDPGSR